MQIVLTDSLARRSPSRVKGIPLDHHPHVGHHPQPVFTMVRRLIDEIRLLACDPGVGFHLGEVDSAPAQRRNEVTGVKVLVAFGVSQYRLAERRGDV